MDNLQIHEECLLHLDAKPFRETMFLHRDTLPADLSFAPSQQSGFHVSEQRGLPQGIANQNLSALNAESGLSVQGYLPRAVCPVR